jgi:hypothetical protein
MRGPVCPSYRWVRGRRRGRGRGRGGDTVQLRALVAELASAAQDDDGDRICNDLFMENLRISVQRASRHSCGQEVANNVASDTSYEVSQIQVTGDNATATLTDQKGTRSDVLFQRDGDKWRIARIAAASAK